MLCATAVKEPCDQDKHQWQIIGNKTEIPPELNTQDTGIKFLQFQRCKKCEYQRLLFTEK